MFLSKIRNNRQLLFVCNAIFETSSFEKSFVCVRHKNFVKIDDVIMVRYFDETLWEHVIKFRFNEESTCTLYVRLYYVRFLTVKRILNKLSAKVNILYMIKSIT